MMLPLRLKSGVGSFRSSFRRTLASSAAQSRTRSQSAALLGADRRTLTSSHMKLMRGLRLMVGRMDDGVNGEDGTPFAVQTPQDKRANSEPWSVRFGGMCERVRVEV